MSTPSLRGLAKAYSDGLIDRQRYIRERRQLIDDIVSERAEIVPYEAPPKAPNPDLERTFSDDEMTLKLSRLDDPEPVPPEAKSKARMFIIAGLALAALALFAWFKMGSQSEPEQPPRLQPPAVDHVEESHRAEELLLGFLDENQWQRERIDAFAGAWRNTSVPARAALASSSAMHLAAEIIYQKILEENALIELGQVSDALENQRLLLDLAATLSLRNDRFVRLENAWRATQAGWRADALLPSVDPRAEDVEAEASAPEAASNPGGTVPVD